MLLSLLYFSVKKKTNYIYIQCKAKSIISISLKPYKWKLAESKGGGDGAGMLSGRNRYCRGPNNQLTRLWVWPQDVQLC